MFGRCTRNIYISGRFSRTPRRTRKSPLRPKIHTTRRQVEHSRACIIIRLLAQRRRVYIYIYRSDERETIARRLRNVYIRRVSIYTDISIRRCCCCWKLASCNAENGSWRDFSLIKVGERGDRRGADEGTGLNFYGLWRGVGI